MSRPVARGFRHLRRSSADEEGRVPPGQYATRASRCCRPARPRSRSNDWMTARSRPTWPGNCAWVISWSCAA